jgi:hypothetical protein
MGAPSRKARRKIRTAAEFDLARLSASIRTPQSNGSVYSWSLADIVAARDAQMRGQFRLPARLAESMRTDDALMVAYSNRLAPQRCVKVELVPAKNARGESIASEAQGLFGQGGVGVHPDTLADVHGCLVNHGVAFAVNDTRARADGSRVDFFLKHWPIEHVRWDPLDRCFKTRIDPATAQPSDLSAGAEVPIIHGDGRWVIFQSHEIDPFKQEAALLAAALVWARHAYALRDWAKGSVAHGNAKVVGEMPAGVALQSDGGLTPEAAAFLELLRAIASSDCPVGIRPAGSKTDLITNTSTAWQIFNELVLNAEKAAARLYLGTDGVLGSNGGAPGVDISALFGVATTKVQGDLACIERALLTGTIEPWCAVNHGDSTLAPERRYLLPDADADAARASLARRTSAFFEEIEKARSNGFAVDQLYVDSVAKKHGIDAPLLPVESKNAPSIALAPADIARVVSVNEARASAGLGDLLDASGGPDPDGRLTVEEFSAKKAAKANEAVAPAVAPKAAA